MPIGVKGRRHKPFVRLGSYKPIAFRRWVVDSILSILLLLWIKRNGLMKKYGLCQSQISSKQMFYYIPLMIMITCNFWLGIKINHPLEVILFYMLSMICVGFLEEIIFRGFLYQAISKDDYKLAIIISSVTFRIGHIINLFNGNATSVVSNMCQIVSAIVLRFLFVILFIRTKSLIPSIITHSMINAFAIFQDQNCVNDVTTTIVSCILMLIAIIYLIF